MTESGTQQRTVAPNWLRQQLAQTTVFWRTFLAQVALIAVGLLVWVQTFVSLEVEPQALQSARQIASLVNLTRAALQHADAIARISLVKTLADEERLRISPRERTDRFQPYGTSPFEKRLSAALVDNLGTGTIVAREVNGFPGLWVGFAMEADTYWMLLDPRRAEGIQRQTWLLWLAAAVSLSVLGAAWVARMVSKPLKALSAATLQVTSGALDAVQLPTAQGASEIRQVNQGFQAMVHQLQELENDRQLMLAGISHDVRTPLARLRLEAEMSVPDEQARQDMVADMEQIEAILRQFLDYARPASEQALEPIDLNSLWLHWQKLWPGKLPVRMAWAPLAEHMGIWGQATELTRMVQNLIENAAKYGKTPVISTALDDEAAPMAHVDVSATEHADAVVITVQDHGPGVQAATLAKLTQPFYRADAARSQAAGAGLGLSVASKLAQRMGGTLTLESVPGEGLKAVIRLRRCAPPRPSATPPHELPG